jgi:hypothetical protein
MRGGGRGISGVKETICFSLCGEYPEVADGVGTKISAVIALAKFDAHEVLHDALQGQQRCCI